MFDEQISEPEVPTAPREQIFKEVQKLCRW